MTSAAGMTAFVPNGDSRKDTATLLLGAALDNGLDETRVVVAAQGGFYISDELADALGGAQDPEDEAEPDEATNEPDGENPETEKAVEQLEAENPPVPDAEAAVDAAVDPANEAEKPAPKARKGAKTSGDRAEKNDSEEE